jgi:NIMA (never in mitosis gene a)-related kinase
MKNYQKVSNLGKGRYGKVCLVQSDFGQLYALKKIPLSPDSKISFEAQVLKSLDHPYIVQYHDSFIENHNLYIVTDYSEGGDLSKRIRAARDQKFYFSEKQVWKWFGQLVEALSYMHSQHVIHRDLKPSNIFLTKDGALQIGDFGFSKVLNYSEELTSSRVGTPYYLAPEICNGSPYDVKADAWSLGCIIYELATLTRLFESDTLSGVMMGILNKEVPLVSRCSSLMNTYIQKLLNRDPSQRLSIIDLGKDNEFINVTCPPIRRNRRDTREIMINIPTPTHNHPEHPFSAKGPIKPNTPLMPDLKTTPHIEHKEQNQRPETVSTVKSSNRHFTFNESLLKKCPNSPIRPMLIGDFIRLKLGDEVFNRVKNVINNAKDPGKLLREEPWIISDICGERNLSIIDVGIAYNAFNTNKMPFPPTSTHRNVGRAFPVMTHPD